MITGCIIKITLIKTRKIRWVGDVARTVEMKPVLKKPVERPKSR